MPKPKISILYINPLESRHGAAYRARNLFKLLQETFPNVVYMESNYKNGDDTISIKQRDTYWGYLVALLKRMYLCWKLDYQVLFLQKALVLNLPPLIIAKLRGKKVVLDFDDIEWGWQSSNFKKFITLLLGEKLPQYADIITTHNQYLTSEINKMGAKKIFFVPQGVDTNLFNPRKYDGKTVKKELGLGDKKILSFLGSFTIGSAIDLHVIFKTFKQVEAARDDVYLLIIGGGGPLEGKYRALIQELGLKNIRITGRVPQSEVPRLLSAVDIGLIYMEDNLTNRCRMSLKLLEYLAMEITVAGHIMGEAKGIFGKYCFLTEPSVDSFASTILEILNNNLKKETASQFIKEQYDWGVVKTYLDSAFRETIHENCLC